MAVSEHYHSYKSIYFSVVSLKEKYFMQMYLSLKIIIQIVGVTLVSF